MKRLLAVSWEMPPMYGPRAMQVSRTMAALAAIGWRPTVVCLAPRRGGPHWRDGLDAGAPDGVDLLRVPSPEEWLVLRAARRLVPPLRDIPDSQRVWVGPAARAAERAAASGEYAGLITFAQPWSDHLVGLRVHRSTSLPWVAHFSDPWVDSPYAAAGGWRQSMSRRMEAEVVREADAVVFVTEETADLVMRKYPAAWRQKVSVVPHGYDPPTERVERPTGDVPTRPLRVVYIGRFYSGVRTPLSFMRALAAVNNQRSLTGTLDVLFMGPHVTGFRRDASALGLDKIVRFEEARPQAEALRTAAEADLLLLIDASTGGQSVFLPSKLIEYLRFRTPILGLTPVDGASWRLLQRLGCPAAPPDEPRALESALRQVIAQWRAGTLQVGSAFDGVAAEYDIRRTTRRLHDVLIAAFGASA